MGAPGAEAYSDVVATLPRTVAVSRLSESDLQPAALSMGKHWSKTQVRAFVFVRQAMPDVVGFLQKQTRIRQFAAGDFVVQA